MTAESPSEARKPRVFVSYVRENQDVVDHLANELRAYGIKVWLDKTELKPGYRWKDAIREAISEGDFFIACFSAAYEKRTKSYMNEELTLAIEELRQRPAERVWFIPVLLSECQVPKRDIGAGETLRDIQWVELYRNWEEGIAKIAATIDPDAVAFNSQINPAIQELKNLEYELSAFDLKKMVYESQQNSRYPSTSQNPHSVFVKPVFERLLDKNIREYLPKDICEEIGAIINRPKHTINEVLIQITKIKDYLQEFQ